MFFYRRSLSDRHLHSFPTRRSSDPAEVPAAEDDAGDLETAPAEPAPFHAAILYRGGSRWRRSAARDRKSTRLNSSHVRISYAVFCLKKKKRIIRGEYQYHPSYVKTA